MKALSDKGNRLGVSGVTDMTTLTEWGSAANGGTPTPLSWQAAEPGSLDHLNGGGPLLSIPARTADRTTDPRRCNCAEYLRRVAPDYANSSRDFGRGFMFAAVALAERGTR